MGMSFAQTLGSTAQSYEDARDKKIKEQQTAEELAQKRDTMAKSLQNEMMRMKIEQARSEYEKQRYLKELERGETGEWKLLKEPTENPDGTWSVTKWNMRTGEVTTTKVGTPVAIRKEGMHDITEIDKANIKAASAMDVETLRGQWRTKVAAMTNQGKMASLDWHRFIADPGHKLALEQVHSYMKRADEVAKILREGKNPFTGGPLKPEERAGYEAEIQRYDQAINQSIASDVAIRNLNMYNQAKSGTKQPAPPTGVTGGPASPVTTQPDKNTAATAKDGAIKWKAGDTVLFQGKNMHVLDPPYDANGNLRLGP